MLVLMNRVGPDAEPLLAALAGGYMDNLSAECARRNPLAPPATDAAARSARTRARVAALLAGRR